MCTSNQLCWLADHLIRLCAKLSEKWLIVRQSVIVERQVQVRTRWSEVGDKVPLSVAPGLHHRSITLSWNLWSQWQESQNVSKLLLVHQVLAPVKLPCDNNWWKLRCTWNDLLSVKCRNGQRRFWRGDKFRGQDKQKACRSKVHENVKHYIFGSFKTVHI